MSALKNASRKLKNFAQSLVGNRIFDLYLKYKGISMLTTATLVPVALLHRRAAVRRRQPPHQGRLQASREGERRQIPLPGQYEP